MLRTAVRSLVIPVLAAAACQPSLPRTEPSSVVIAVFDPTTSRIPLPNDLAFLNPPNSVCPPPANQRLTEPPACAQAELLVALGGGGIPLAGAFPGDQVVPITIEFTQIDIESDGTQATSAPDLDLESFTPSTFFVVGNTPAGRGEIAIEPLTSASYVKSDDHGTLTLRRAGNLPWDEGSYAVFVRGGPLGVKTMDGTPVNASQVFHLIAQGKDMTAPENLGLLRAQTGSLDAALALGGQLNQLITLYDRLAFPFADDRFPHQELAIAQTFKIAPVVTHVPIDPARGLVPLPIDLLRDAGTGRLSPLAACTLAGAELAPDGSCASPAAAGFAALDGFSTTGAILAPTSELIQVPSITADTLQLYDLSDPARPARVPASDLILEPCEVTSVATGDCKSPTALSPVIAIQPAGATRGDLSSALRTRPLKDGTTYAVVLTTGIRDKAGRPIGRGTVAKILGFKNPLVVGDRSALQGIDDSTARALDKMRLQLQPVFTLLGDPSKVALAYTFRTQTILSTAVQLGALPYTAPAATALPIANSLVVQTPTEAFTRFGVDPAVVPGTGADDHIDQILEVDITTFDLLDPVSGAFRPDPAQAAATPIRVMIATPKPNNDKIAVCAGSATVRCAPMMVFRHGFGRGRADMLQVADKNAEAGMITVAIDAAKHGDRTLCRSGVTGPAGGCNPDVACTTTLPPGAQGDAQPPGSCGVGGLFKQPVMAGVTGATDGIPAASGQYLVTINFFRTRDTLRQDIIDQSQLIRALAFAPAAPPSVPSQTGHLVFDHIFNRSAQVAQRGLVIDPTKIYFSGQSLGAIQGAVDVAANPRISKAVFNVGGGTLVDVFTNSPAFKAQTDELLGGRSEADLLQFLVVAKTVLDPADPINFIGHLTDPMRTLPNLLPPLGGNPNGMVRQAQKRVLHQFANCDSVVPNPFNFIFGANTLTTSLPLNAEAGARGTVQMFVQTGPSDLNSCPTTAVPHNFLTNWRTPFAALAQDDVTTFVTDDAFSPLVFPHP